ncbi:hypothetical protein M885DRAFT_503731 [Pelagophyceae sp. CCMP2097]|nr:hypothetical protein M885DRAFT_503731 [Pelagophyceae sp. CCMP2097]
MAAGGEASLDDLVRESLEDDGQSFDASSAFVQHAVGAFCNGAQDLDALIEIVGPLVGILRDALDGAETFRRACEGERLLRLQPRGFDELGEGYADGALSRWYLEHGLADGEVRHAVTRSGTRSRHSKASRKGSTSSTSCRRARGRPPSASGLRRRRIMRSGRLGRVLVSSLRLS